MTQTEPKVAKVQMNINNSHGTCRVCMRKNNSMKELFVPDSKIVDRIQFCTGIFMIENPNLPSFICKKCLLHLRIAYNFKTACIVSDKIFKAHVKVEVKTEIFDDTIVKEEIEAPCENVVELNDSKETMRLLIENELDISKKIVKLPNSVPKEIVKHSLSPTDTIKLKVVCKEEQVKQKQVKTTKKEKQKPSRKRITFRKLFCLKCNIRFDSKEDSIEHHETLHNIFKYVCEVCGKQFVYQGAYNCHMRIHVGPSYSCEHCAYATIHKHDLITHLRSHTGETKYQCHVCSRPFRTCSNLHTHIRAIHNGHKKYSCELCDKKFTTRSCLRRHLDAHNNIKRYECPVCHSCFVLRSGWKRHMLSQHAVTVPTAKPGPRKSNLAIEPTQTQTQNIFIQYDRLQTT